MMDILRKVMKKVSSVGSLNDEDTESHDPLVPVCVLLLDMARVDGECTEEEEATLIAVLKKNYRLSDRYVASLIDTARKELKGSIDLWQFTNFINKNYSTEDKRRIIHMVWTVAFADGELDKYEDHLVHKLARLLQLTHKELIDAKLAANQP